jgi:type III secretory pathway component EscT
VPADDTLAAWLTCALLLALRLGPLVLIAPWLAAGYAPRLVQLAITVCLVVCMLPVAVTPASLAVPSDTLSLALLGMRELLIGLVLGVSLAVPVLAVRWAGELIGISFGGSHDDESPLATLHGLFAAALFVTLGGHRLALAAIARSLEAVPLATLALPANSTAIATGSALLLGQAIATAVLIALPVLIALALSDALLAWFARVSSVAFLPDLAGTTRAALALAVVWMSFAALVGSLPGWLDGALSQALKLWSTP